MKLEPAPLGLPPDAPRELRSPRGSFVRALHPDQHRHLKATVLTSRFLPVLLLGALLLAILVILVHLSRQEPNIESVPWVGVVVVGAGILVVLPWLVFNRRITAALVRAKVRSRRTKVFEPDARTFVVAVEDAGTFDKLKVAPEDYALMRPSPKGIDLEMSRCQVHLALEDTRVALHSPEGQKIPSAAMNLSAELQGWTWAVALQTTAIPLRPSEDQLDPQGNTLNIVARIAEDADPALVEHIPWQRVRRGLFGQ